MNEEKILVIKCKKPKSQKTMDEIRRVCLHQMQEGVILLPSDDYEFAFIDKEKCEIKEIEWKAIKKRSWLDKLLGRY